MDSTFNPDGSISESDTDTSYVNTVTTSIGELTFLVLQIPWVGLEPIAC